MFWTLFSFLLGQYCKGNLYAQLAKKSVPTFPTTFESLLQHASVIPIFRFSAKESLDANSTSISDTTQKNVQDRLNLATTKIRGKYIDVVAQIAAGHPVIVENNQSVAIMPSVFAVWGSSLILNWISGSMESFTKYVAVQNPSASAFISMRWSWIAGNDCFYPGFSKTLGHISEAGLQERWQKLNEAGELLNGISKMGIEPEKQGVNHFARIFLCNDNKQREQNFQITAATLRDIEMPLAIWGVFCVLSILSFFIELGFPGLARLKGWLFS